MWLSTYLLAAYGIPGTPLLSSMDLLFDDTHRAANRGHRRGTHRLS